jgi:hypothetical protein
MSLTTAVSLPAFADGWICRESDGGPLRATVYHHTRPEAGTRNVAAFILSSVDQERGRRTIVAFRDDMNRSFLREGQEQRWEVLSNEGSRYIGRVFLQFGSHRAGELIPNRGGEGARLGNVEAVELDVDFSYAAPVPAGAVRDAVLTVRQRDGESFAIEMECRRHLRGAGTDR